MRAYLHAKHLSVFRALLFCCCVGLWGTVSAQEENALIDSLKTQLSTHSSSPDSVLHYTLDIAKAYTFWNNDSIQSYAQKAVDLALAAQDTNALAQGLHHLSRAHLLEGRNALSGKALLELIAFGDAVNDPMLRVMAHINMADLIGYQNKVDSAVGYLDRALVLLQKYPDVYHEASVNLTYGNLWLQSRRLEEARDRYLNALDLYTQAQKDEGRAQSLINLGAISFELGDYPAGVEYYEQGIEVYRSNGNKINLSIALANLGGVLMFMDELDRAEAMLQEAKTIQDETGQAHGGYVITGTLGSIYRKRGQYQKALTNLHQALDELRQIGIVQMEATALVQLQETYAEMGDMTNAYKYQSELIVLQDSLTRAENTAAMAALDVKQEYALKALQDSLEYVHKTEAFDAQTRIERRTRNGLIGGVVLLLAFGAILLNRYRVTRSQKTIIEESAAELAESEAQRTRFFANISHEFRTPLSVINGMSELIAANPDKWAGKGSKLIYDNGTNLLDLVNQILDLQKLENREVKPHLVQSDVVPYLRSCVGMFEGLAVKKGLDFSFVSKVDTLVMDVDREKLLRILSNLIGNAIKFTEKGAISIQASEREVNGQSHLVIDVEDSGIGIDAEYLEKVFQRFYQVDNEHAQVGQGTGIGLNYVHELVTLLGGKLEVQSTPGDGATFTVLLPVTNQSPELEHVEALDPPMPASPKSWKTLETGGPELLIVEDNPDIIELLLGHLGSEYTVRVAENGLDGIDAAKQHVPDLVLTDVMMPGKNGFEVLDDLKNDPITSHIPVVMLTAKSDVESRMDGLRRGADDYLGKPFHAEELRLRLQKVLLTRAKYAERYAEGPPEAPSSDPETQLEDAFLIRIEETLLDNLDDHEFGIPQFCTALGVSRTQLHTKLKALTGKSTSIYIRERRLEQAKALLENPELTVSEVAYQTGFSSPTYFTRVFTQHYGTSPSIARS